MRAKELREEARNCLQGKWGKAIVISLIYTAITFVIVLLANYISSIFNIATLIIAPPLTYGLAYSYYHLKNGEEVSYADLLKVGFANFGRSWAITWEIFKKCWWCILLAIIPVIIMFVLIGSLIFGASTSILGKTYNSSYYYDTSSSYTDYLDNYYKYDYNYNYNYDYDYDDYLDDYYNSYNYGKYSNSLNENTFLAGMSTITLIGIFVMFILYIVIAILTTIRMLLYTLSFYIAVAKDGISPKDAVQESARLMKGNRGKYFCLILSFFGWALLLGLIAGIINLLRIEILTEISSQIGAIILTPYIAFSVIAFYQNLDRNNNIGMQNSKKYCTNCGQENKIDAMFCTNCGNKF